MSFWILKLIIPKSEFASVEKYGNISIGHVYDILKKL